MSWVCTRVYACVSSSTHMYGGQKSVMNALNHLPHYFFLHQGSLVGPGDGQFGYCGWLTNCKDTAVLRLQMHHMGTGVQTQVLMLIPVEPPYPPTSHLLYFNATVKSLRSLCVLFGIWGWAQSCLSV